MEPVPARPWYKKKRYLIPLGVGALFAFSALASPSPALQTSGVQVSQPVQDYAAPTTVVAPGPSTIPAGLSNDSYYTNVDGNQVHSPAYSNTAPAGASAQCRDGTYSFSQHRSGTCSHHGGVADWL